ncbi:MAG: peptide-methionine (S)-S-oxide reductase MsrA [Aquiluna sp.]|jgi:peptide-methionine (S)-S-oxide reductase|uniref:peptide-methionine (S)-S-oxide reductase MsrA n=1 Tax=Aquiluna sp. TaxID=2053504 RepID=UPI00275FBB68|nr:peptide-methionine (S)-S-oxide reductase MsrA [Aquiluna sp.]
METFVLGGGCFWCLDSAYVQFRGISDVTCGYTGGSVASPTYEAVCNGNTGHAEIVSVTFDPEVISSEQILDIFFTLHDPTQLNRQGNDVGTQYRSSMFYASPEQKEIFEAAIERAKYMWGEDIVTEVAPLRELYDAEEYHQDFFAKNPDQGYCVAVVAPKVSKVRAKFSDLLA